MSQRTKLGIALTSVALAGVGSGLALSGRLHIPSAHAAPAPAPAPAAGTPQQPTPAVVTGAPNFVQLVKDVGPAVVNVQVKMKPSQNRNFRVFHMGGGGGGEDFDPFGGGGGGMGMDPFGDEGPPQGGGEGLGTGFFISADGYILTNDHVVGNASEIHVILADGREFAGKAVGSDPKTDIALVKIEDSKPFPYVKLGDSDKLDIGEWVVAIGNPFGLDHTVTAGIVSAKQRHNIHPDGRKNYSDFIQTDASINPGNSGGPLINTAGEVVGINAAINPQGQGLGFAIPINMAKTIVPMLKSNGKVARSWLGVNIQPVTKDLAKALKLPSTEGALVARVVTGSPAEKAGVKAGDVITMFDGKPIETADDLPWIASTAGVGKTVPVTIAQDGGKSKNVDIKLEEMPDDETLAQGGGSVTPNAPSPSKAANLGVSVEKVTPAIAQELGLDKAEGVVVDEVDQDAAAGNVLTRGDVIVSIAGQPVKTPADFEAATKSLKSGDTLRLLVVRGGSPMWVAFTIG